MTERGRASVTRDADSFAVGPSSLHWGGDALTIDVDEITAPIPRRVRGRVRIYPEILASTEFALDPAAEHRWHPVAPRARVTVDMRDPDLAWGGSGYIDSNFGNTSLEDGFIDWNWSRAHLRHDVAVLYEGTRRTGEPFELALRCDPSGVWHDIESPPPAHLPRTGWLMPRTTRADTGSRPRIVKTWEDAPFYSRSAIVTRLLGEDVHAVHESVALDRFRSPLVLSMLPYKMPRALF